MSVEEQIKKRMEAMVRYEQEKVKFQPGTAWNWPKWFLVFGWFIPYLTNFLFFVITAPKSPATLAYGATILLLVHGLLYAWVAIMMRYWPV
jgi:hypothetical protein